MTYREAARKLAALGCRNVPRRRGGSHRKWIEPSDQSLDSAARPRRPGPRLGTLRAAVRQLGIEWTLFEQA